MKEFDFLETQEGRAKFIRENESGIYAGKTVDGLGCTVYLDRGEGMEIDIEQPTKPHWVEVIYYDKDGFHEGSGVEWRG